MRRLIISCVAVLMLTCQQQQASAVVIEQTVTPASVQEKDSRFSVKAEKRKDGMIHFEIIYRPTRPQYVVSHFSVREGANVVAQVDTPSFVRDKAATFHVAIEPKHLANSHYEISEHSFVESNGQAVPMPGGTIYQFKLEAFGHDAPAPKVD
jgi:hypothetical protein